VTESQAIEGWRPTEEQLLLLQAALFDGEDALAAWRAWSARADIERLDPGSNRMLPLVSYNLDRLGVDDPLSARLRGYRRQTWYKNQIWLSEMARFLAEFERAGLQTLVLKGTALVLLFYPDCGLRPMTDLDLLVRRDQARAAMSLLAELGWKANDEDMERRVRSASRKNGADANGDLASATMISAALERRVRQGHATDFVNSARLRLDLHWYVLPENRGPDADTDFWNDAVPVRIGNFTTKALSPTDTLLHVCVHGAKWCPVPPMRWVADAMMIMRAASDQIDWNRLVRLARKRRLSLPLGRALTYLAENMRAPIPPAVLLELRDTPTTWSERMEYRMFSRPRKAGENYSALSVLWFVHRRLDEARSGLHSVVTFPLYLQHCFALEQFSDLAPFIFSKLVQRGRRRFGWEKLKSHGYR
jgi:hypothetical protein